MSDVEVNPARAEPQYPWRLNTNDRYRETVTTIMSLSTAALLLPVFLAREFLGIKSDVALKNVFTCAVYWSWGLLGFSIFSGVVWFPFRKVGAVGLGPARRRFWHQRVRVVH